MDLEIKNLLGETFNDWGISIKADLGNGWVKIYEHNSDLEFPAASIKKLFIAYCFFYICEKENIDINKEVVIMDDLKSPGTGTLQSWQTPAKISLINAVSQMLTCSDNTSAKVIGRLITGKRINEILQENNFNKSLVEVLDGNIKFYFGDTTPIDTLNLLEKLIEGKLLNPKHTELFIKFLAHNQYSAGITRDLYFIKELINDIQEINILNKEGMDNDDMFQAIRNEAGVILVKAKDKNIKIILSIFSKNGADKKYSVDNKSVLLINRISDTAIKYVLDSI